MKAMILNSMDRDAAFIKIVLCPKSWSDDETYKKANDAMLKAEEAIIEEWDDDVATWDDYKAALEKVGFIVPEVFSGGPMWDIGHNERKQS
jgi:hypothetical protein